MAFGPRNHDARHTLYCLCIKIFALSACAGVPRGTSQNALLLSDLAHAFAQCSADDVIADNAGKYYVLACQQIAVYECDTASEPEASYCMRTAVGSLAEVLPEDRSRAAIRNKATRLFDRGREMLDAGRRLEGCDLLSESDALQRTPSSTANLGECDEHDGQLVYAWELYHKAEELAKLVEDESMARKARDSAQKLAATLCTLNITLSDTSFDGLTILIGDRVLVPTARIHTVGQPGTLALVVAPPGAEPFHQTIRCVAGASMSIVVPALVEARAEPGGNARSATQRSAVSQGPSSL